ncbi:MAG: adenosylcobalamin-dependent ribonucleoside-diphosphate reductase, partial [Methanomicrobiales archaeon]|nr:adenosylcobalamin-dependent ribonucleoside-diphosphate reductase [Methanomicrobiales archaeon]
MNLTEIARDLLAKRYLLPGETPPDLFRRVAHAINSPKEKDFLAMMEDLLFLPNSPTLMNAGAPAGQLSACFVLPVEDTIEGIFSTLAHMAVIHKTGGGTGFSFSKIRPRGDNVSGTVGVASGPVSFIEVFDKATDAVKQGGKRRGANMAVLASWHPDIREFIRSKMSGGLTNFNISVAFDARYFQARSAGKEYPLINPRDGSTWGMEDPEAIWRAIGEAAWATGDPGMIFLDEINRRNPTPGLGLIEATNPCGEQPLYPYESCNLGSINLSLFVQKGEIDWDHLRTTVRDCVDFLDGVIDINRFPIPRITEMTQRTRKIGLGVMGFAELLIRLGIPYSSPQALEVGEQIMAFIQTEAKLRSRELGEQKGSFPAIDQSIFTNAMRNSTVTTIAPTGSLHIVANTSSGIEPLFSLAYTRVIADTPVEIVNDLVKDLAQQY